MRRCALEGDADLFGYQCKLSVEVSVTLRPFVIASWVEFVGELGIYAAESVARRMGRRGTISN